jgi:glyoxylase-like metal-dependent hydrolase (beta-lactamase superfamily II)
MALPVYEAFAIKYAERSARRPEHFVHGDPHDGDMPMDYFLWLVRGEGRTYVVDTGFTAEVAAKRGRRHLRTARAALALLGVAAETVRDVIVTHLHYDHIGGFHDFPAARFHLQDTEMAFATGRHMKDHFFNHSYECEDVVGIVRMVFKNRVEFHDGEAALAPGLTLHHIGGHTAGLQCVRVHTRRGWVVLASDTTHYYEHFEQRRCFPITYHVGDVMDGYDTLLKLAASPQHVIPGHDPLVMTRYPAVSPALAGIAVRLDVAPAE